MTGSRRFPPFAGPRARPATQSPQQPRGEELPSIQQFLDDLPPIENFLAEEQDPDNQVAVQAPPLSVDSAAAGWAEGEWQSYDWNAASSLSRAERPSAAEEWGDSEWPGEGETQSSRFPETLAPDEIADALDGIARQIRSGELVIDNLHGTPPEVAMAAALAVLLRMRG